MRVDERIELRSSDVYEYEGYKAVYLFPYLIHDVNNFYLRDHPVGIPPQSRAYKKYWTDFLKPCLEGKWINDGGTWVFMPPKLFFYINYVEIPDKNKRTIKPRLADIEWIYFTYFLVADGFSGFEDDDKYTCHRLVEKHNTSGLSHIEEKLLPKSVYNKKGELKQFVPAWDYLRRTYLLDDPRGPLGKALYDNDYQNIFILAGRTLHKSYSVFMGDFLHEWLFSNCTDYDSVVHRDKKREDNPLMAGNLFGLGSAAGPQLQRSLNLVRKFYDAMPGKFMYRDSERKPFMGPYYKNIAGSWKVGRDVTHVIKDKGQTDSVVGSFAQMMALTKDKTTIGAGDRFRRIYVEEVGFTSYLKDVFAANEDSVRVSLYESVGSMVFLGTSGSLESIREPKEIFEHPLGYNVACIPDYWKNPKKRLGLFMPTYYREPELKDENGNTYIPDALKGVIQHRKDKAEEVDSVSYSQHVMYNPISPKEMLIPNRRGILPVKEAADRLADIDAYDLFKSRANWGRLSYDATERYGVGFDKDVAGSQSPIVKYNVDMNKINTSTPFVMYEPPTDYIPENLYWVIYDPAAKSGEGTSFHSVLVYKHFYAGRDKTLYDTIVAEWLGREETLEDNYKQVIKIAKFYNAKIFPERNIHGFPEWCRTNNYYNMLQPDSYQLELENDMAPRRRYHRVGFEMSQKKKFWCLQQLRSWLLEAKEHDPRTGVPTIRTMDWIFSPRILDEIINYDGEGNFDHLSSLLGLMLLKGALDKDPITIEEPEQEQVRNYEIVKPTITRRRSKFEQMHY